MSDYLNPDYQFGWLCPRLFPFKAHRDHDSCYDSILPAAFDLSAFVINPTSPRSPWQNGYAERLIGSIRRECLDHVVVFGGRHLRHVLSCYMNYYNTVRPHLSLDKDAPIQCLAQTIGCIKARPLLGGLLHQYVRI